MLPKLPSRFGLHPNSQFMRALGPSGDIRRARQLFDEIPHPDIRSWTLLITAYTRSGFPKEALEVYDELREKKVHPDQLALLSVTKGCAALGNLIKAKGVHEDVIRYGYRTDLLLGNALIDMYGKCKYALGAREVFDNLSAKDVISWTSMSSCYVNCKLPSEALIMFREMGLNGMRPNPITLSTVLPACSDLKSLNLGREIHGYIVRNGIHDNVYVSSALVDMYASCSSIKQAETVFNSMRQFDYVLCNVIMSAYFSNGECDKALRIFDQLRKGRTKLNHDSWNSVIGGCMQSGRTDKALQILHEMQQSGVKPNKITITSVLHNCIDLGSIRRGKEIHGFLLRDLFLEDETVFTALVFMYAKCGDLELSNRVFYMMPKKDTIAWNTMIIGNSMHGKGEEALLLFREMVSSGVKPNSVTFTGVLSGCSHSQLVDKGLVIFYTMRKEHGVEPDSEHYSCMVDALSRAGRLEQAYNFIQNMPMKPSAGAWGALLGACRVYKNVEMARVAGKQLLEIEPENAGNYVLLSNIYEAAKLREEASEIRKLMRERGIMKVPGCSWIQVKDKVHTFVVGDKNNAQTTVIYSFLTEVGEKMRLAGYLPCTDLVGQDLDAEEKENSLCSHSERLAVAFGILNLDGASSITVFKNLRICGDCHNAIKYLAKIVGVQIIVRDSLRFHHFKDGLCSCRDFW
ncbi:pentatricopeptide repeat-containing protein At1g20230-like [Solanum stenotomum]|uniref:pentatricopeptide repeat-containing protein At1g20230-like n=1 Tax=Solanum stenotomum TaxID=172797 RepID=UPI0020D1015D|nr:pentatricopeptide repeat-containing protein At1g20230-like [Solanum stenotomum]